MLVYTIKIQPQAEGFATSAAAFQSIASKLNASVQSGAFTMALNAISAASSHVLDAPAASNSISIEYYPGVGMPTASPQAFNSTIASASSQGGGPQNTDSEILVIAIIAAIVGLCLLGAGCIVAIRKINFLSQRKKEANIKAERTIMPEDTMQPYRNYVFDEDDLIDL